MLFEQWSSLVDELRIEVLSKLINAKEAPHALLQIAATNWEMKDLVQDFSIWRPALRDYFPHTEIAYPDEFENSSFDCFKKWYVACESVMTEKKFSMSDYIHIVSEEWHNIPKEKKDILIGLGLVAGFEHKFAKKDITPPAQGYALLFATALGLKPHIKHYIGLSLPTIEPDFIRQGLQLTAKLGDVLFFSYYLTHAHARLDASSKRSALIKATENGQLNIIQIIVQTPNYLHGAIFALRRAVHIAAEKGHVKILQLLMEKLPLISEDTTIKSALKLACEKRHADVACVILQHASAQIDAKTIIALFKQAAKAGNIDIVALFFKYAHNSLSTTPTVQNTLRKAMAQKNEQIILLLLKERHVAFNIFIKQELLMMAASAGYESIVHFLLDNETTALDNDTMKRAGEVAGVQGHIHIERLLKNSQEKASDIVRLSHQIADLTLEGEGAVFTPQFQSSRISKEENYLACSTNRNTHPILRIS